MHLQQIKPKFLQYFG